MPFTRRLSLMNHKPSPNDTRNHIGDHSSRLCPSSQRIWSSKKCRSIVDSARYFRSGRSNFTLLRAKSKAGARAVPTYEGSETGSINIRPSKRLRYSPSDHYVEVNPWMHTTEREAMIDLPLVRLMRKTLDFDVVRCRGCDRFAFIGPRLVRCTEEDGYVEKEHAVEVETRHTAHTNDTKLAFGDERQS